jgi:hypothetical protein
MQRGNLLLKQGDFDDAKADFESVVCRYKYSLFILSNFKLFY